MAENPSPLDLLSLTAQIVSSHVANNTVSAGELPQLIGEVYQSLAGLGREPEPREEEQRPTPGPGSMASRR